MKTASVFSFVNRLPKVTARPFSLRTSSSETARIFSCEGISRGPGALIGGLDGGRKEGLALSDGPAIHKGVHRRDEIRAP